ncbi:MAG: hypothetical protein LBJ36_07305 [Synergistaceae bacterium]|jgi:hypothetical protein|nr:hypothetical protein [Synergistaceae bacterium]
MTWRKVANGLLFCAGMLAGFVAGHLFYFERYMPGCAMFTLTALFLFYALTNLHIGAEYAEYDEEFSSTEELDDLRKTLANLALMVAQNAIDGAKNIGRAMPPTPAELTRLEDDLMPLLIDLQSDRKGREHIMQELDKLRTRSRQSEGRRALSDKSFRGR